MTRPDLRNEDGWILVSAISLLAIMLTFSLASYAFIDGNQGRTREQRERETSLNLAEGVLFNQGFALAQQWPGNPTGGSLMPTTCDETYVAPAPGTPRKCPDPKTLAAAQGSPSTANFANVDASANVTFKTRIRDNGGPLAGGFVFANVDAQQSGTNVRTGLAYTCPGPCKWDANGDRQLWVQARTVVRGKPRNVVALLKREVFGESITRAGVVAGSFATSNSGNKTIIDSRGSVVITRCTGNGADCTQYQGADPADNKEQVVPEPIKQDPSFPSTMSAAQLARFKIAAQTASPPTYYDHCPTAAETYSGAVVYIDVPATTTCTDVNGATYNSPTEYGIVIMPRGRLVDLKGKYYAILYLANQQGDDRLDPPVLSLGANAEIIGGVAVDGFGHLDVGQASGNTATITFNAGAFDSLATFGTTGLVQNTWRELPPADLP